MYQDSYREDNVFSKYRGLEIDTCLLAGLGELELIPKWFNINYPNCKIDVVEKDTSRKSSLNNNVIYADIFTFVPEQKYSLIILDIWYAGTLNYRKEIEVLKLKYFHYLNKNGMMSFPMIDMHTVFSYVELQRSRN